MLILLLPTSSSSPFPHVTHFTNCQPQGDLDLLINYRKDLVQSLVSSPYEPSLYLLLASVDNKLGFADVAVANAFRGLILIRCGLNICQIPVYPVGLKLIVRLAVSKTITSQSTNVGFDHFAALHEQAVEELLNGLLGSAAFWDGISEAKLALQIFPGNREIREVLVYLKEGFLDLNEGLKAVGANPVDLVAISRVGKIYQKIYPWMDRKLLLRSSSLLKEVNESLKGTACEVRPVKFGPLTAKVCDQARKRCKRSSDHETNEDVGPLGLFATRDVEAGELMMVDKSITGISEVSPTSFKYCEACHAALFPPYLHPSEIFMATCCKKAAYCSRECHVMAWGSYHRVICGKDFEWLYQHSSGRVGKRCGTTWRPIMFLRLIAIYLSDERKMRGRVKSSSIPSPELHPLQHPLIARMAANYPVPDSVKSGVQHEWQLFENVVAPTRILMQLGVDIFRNTQFTPEVIQTIFWRIENNVNMATTNVTPGGETISIVNLNQNYLFMNHSCEPNVSWHGAIPNAEVSIDWLRDMNGKILKPGCSAVWCIAARDIKAGEELKISYVGDPLGSGEQGRREKRAWLAKWFDQGCGCSVCESENVEEAVINRTATEVQPK